MPLRSRSKLSAGNSSKAFVEVDTVTPGAVISTRQVVSADEVSAVTLRSSWATHAAGAGGEASSGK